MTKDKQKHTKEEVKVKTKVEKNVKAEVKEDPNLLKIKELEDRILRIQAEAQNFKRRSTEEADRTVKYANEQLIEELLPVLDNFERAISLDDDNLDDELSKFLEGFKLIYGSLISIFDKVELKEIIALDQPFDPAYHQAILTDKDESKEDGLILEVLQKGYTLKDKVIRPSLVKVNNI